MFPIMAGAWIAVKAVRWGGAGPVGAERGAPRARPVYAGSRRSSGSSLPPASGGSMRTSFTRFSSTSSTVIG